MATLVRLSHECKGSSAIEYTIIGSVISIAIVAAAAAIAQHVGGMLEAIGGHL